MSYFVELGALDANGLALKRAGDQFAMNLIEKSTAKSAARTGNTTQLEKIQAQKVSAGLELNADTNAILAQGPAFQAGGAAAPQTASVGGGAPVLLIVAVIGGAAFLGWKILKKRKGRR